jgi:hypothetical protein
LTAATPQYRRFLTTDPDFVARFGDPFRPLEPECRTVQFSGSLTDDQLGAAGALLAERPDVELYAYGRASRDLDFLGCFPALKRLNLQLWELEDIGGFASIAAGLNKLTFGRTKKSFSLRFLESMGGLEELFLVGHKKDIQVVSGLAPLTDLGLSGITLPDLSLLLPLTSLRRFSLLLGATTNLGLLAEIPALEQLMIMRPTGLSDVSVVADCTGLTTLRLDWLRNVTELPSFAPLTRLEEVTLDQMKGIASLESVAAAANLRRLKVVDTPRLTAESFRCLVGHPSLESLQAYVGRSRDNAAIKAMFPGVAV